MNRIDSNNVVYSTDEYTERDRVSVLSRRLYENRYRDVRRPDRTKLWKASTGLQSVLSVGIRENSLPFFSKGRAKYIKEHHAIEFLDEYISTRIHSNGSTKSPIEEREIKQPSNIRYGFVQRVLGVRKIVEALHYIADIQLRILEQLNELNEVWKPTTPRDVDDTRSTGGNDTQRAG